VSVPPNASDLPGASAALAGLAAGDPPRVDTAGAEIRLAVADASASAEAVRRLDARRMPIIAVELQQPSLDDVFLALTRHSAGDQPAEHPRVQEAA
jgi:hypothetical protein